MGSMRINFADVESSFEPLPEGAYECIVETVEVRESKSSDNPYLNWELKVLDDEYEGRRLWMITSLSEKAMFRLKDVFLALDVIADDEEVEIEWDDEVDITPQEGPVLVNPEVIGLACTAIVTNETYEGRLRNRVNELAGSNGGATRSSAKRRSSTKASNGSASSRKQAAKSASKSASKKSAATKSSSARRRLR
jgi:hypothetical protein